MTVIHQRPNTVTLKNNISGKVKSYVTLKHFLKQNEDLNIILSGKI